MTPIGKSLICPIGILSADALLKRSNSLDKREAILGSVRWKLRCNLRCHPDGRGGRAYRRKQTLLA